MSKSTDLLNALYKNSQMGTTAIQTILPEVQDEALRQELKDQLSTYEEESKELSRRLENFHEEPQGVGVFTTAYADASAKISALIDSSPSHIAQMMMQGTNMGIIEINKHLNDSEGIAPELKRTAEAMLKQEQKYLDRMKAYL